MRICIPTETNEGKDARVFGHFGSAPFFTVYDPETGDIEVLNNSNEHHEHGACNPIGILMGSKIGCVICCGMGARAVQILNQNGIKVLMTKESTVKDAIKNYLSDDLEEITPENACNHHNCH